MSKNNRKGVGAVLQWSDLRGKHLIWDLNMLKIAWEQLLKLNNNKGNKRNMWRGYNWAHNWQCTPFTCGPGEKKISKLMFVSINVTKIAECWKPYTPISWNDLQMSDYSANILLVLLKFYYFLITVNILWLLIYRLIY